MKSKVFIFLLGFFIMSDGLASNKIIFPIRRLPVPLDPQNYDHIYSMVGMIQVHRGLLKFLPNLEIAPDLAESFKVLDGGKKLVFKIKEAKFSNGEKVTSLYVVRTFQRMFKDKTSFAQDINYIKNGHEILNNQVNYDLLGVRAIDEMTVEFELTKPSGIFLSHLATIDSAIIPVDKNLNYSWEKMGGAGAYELDSIKGKSVFLKARNGAVKSDAPHLIEIKEMSELEAQAGALSGEVDSLDGYSTPKEIVESLSKKGWKPSVSTLTRQLLLGINPNKVDAKTRKTIADAINGKDFDLLSASYRRGAGIIPFGLAGAFPAPSLQAVTPNPIKKKKLIQLVIVDAEPLIPHLAEQIKKELARWNIILEVKSVSIDQYLAAIRSKEYEIILRSKFLDYPDGYSILAYFRSNYSQNTFFVANKKVDTLLDRALSEIDVSKRADLYRQIQDLILVEHTVIPLVFGSNNLGLWSNKFALIPAHPLGVQGLAFENLRMKQ